MLNQHLNFPAFDALEYTPELEFTYHRYIALKPLKAGAAVPELSANSQPGKWHAYFHENLFNVYGMSFQYVKKPLVLYFYSKEWGQASIEHLKQLQAVKSELALYNSNVLVIHAEEPEELNRIFWEHNLSLETYFDKEHEIASLLGVYHLNSPAWSKYAGVQNNVPLPAIYALDHERKVVFDFSNDEILTRLPLSELKETTEHYAQYESHKKSA